MGKLTEEKYRELIKKAVTNQGNHYRIQKAIQKAGTDTVSIAFLGGSVTEGYNPKGMIADNYAALFCRYFKNKYAKSGDCICINAGASSENSMLGLVYADNRVKEVRPDIVFVEYAINNGMDQISIASYESLIYKLLTMESNPAVIAVIVCNKDLYSCSGYMEIAAKYYDLPIVNLYDVIRKGLENNSLQWEDYSNDYGHPSEQGHKMIFDGILQLFENMDNCNASEAFLPSEPCFSRDFHTLEYFDHRSLHAEDCGSFIPKKSMDSFPNGWSYKKGTGRHPLIISVVCKSCFVIYEQSNSMDFGEIELLGEDNVINSIDSYSICGFNNPDIKLVINEETTRQYRIKIQMRKGDENKKFSILGFGIVK